MAFFAWLRRLYSPDTLDTRFTTSSSTPLRQTSDTNNSITTPHASTPHQSSIRTRNSIPPSSPPKWNTTEYYFYYFVFITCIPLMFHTVYYVSRADDPRYHKFEPRLSRGWIPGRKVDNSDGQYASFRDNIPYLAALLCIHPAARWAWNKCTTKSGGSASNSAASSSSSSSPAQQGGHKRGDSGRDAGSLSADARFEQRVSFDYAFALIFLFALHGLSACKILAIMAFNYRVATRLPRKWVPAATWVFNVGTLFANELTRGYQVMKVAALLGLQDGAALRGLAGWVDGMGLIPRWEVLFNLTVLRLISFNMDYYWSLDYRAGSPIEKKQLDPANLSERDRVSVPASPKAYSFRNYIAYALYSPLYLTGPIITFNDYISQCRYPSPSLSSARTFRYGIRFFVALLCMELILHYIYVVAIAKSSPDWSTYSPLQITMQGFFNLHIIWLKLLLPWRFFRLWALIDNIDPPENMVRCMSNNYSAVAFWRSWHRSFNRWIVRYIYIPLGGSGGSGTSRIRSIANFLAVFTFVALWHDISLHLLMWGWLITLFVIPEILAGIVFPASAYRDRPTTYRMLAGLGACFNCTMMTVANLVGFAVGAEGIVQMVKGVVGTWGGLAFFAAAVVALFANAQMIFEVREEELRDGIYLKC